MPKEAPFPEPTIIATGVAKPKAHGQATTKTLIAMLKLYSAPFPSNR